MATNNNVNNSFPSGLTSTGTTNINSSGSGATTIGNSSAGILAFASNSNSTFTLNNAQFDLTTGTGSINICSNSTAQTINIGSSSTNNFTLNSPLTINSGTSSTDSSFSLSGATTFRINGAGALSNLNCTGDFTFGNTSGATWSIANFAGASNTTIGNTSSSSTLTLEAGTGGISMNNGIAKTVTIGNTTGSTQINISTGSGGILWPNITNSNSTATIGANTVINAGALSTMPLPTTISVGGIIKINSGATSSAWKITQAAGQQINSTATSTTSGTGGSLASSNKCDCVELVCTVANTTFTIVNSQGTLTFV